MGGNTQSAVLNIKPGGNPAASITPGVTVVTGALATEVLFVGPTGSLLDVDSEFTYDPGTQQLAALNAYFGANTRFNHDDTGTLNGAISYDQFGNFTAYSLTIGQGPQITTDNVGNMNVGVTLTAQTLSDGAGFTANSGSVSLNGSISNPFGAWQINSDGSFSFASSSVQLNSFGSFITNVYFGSGVSFLSNGGDIQLGPGNSLYTDSIYTAGGSSTTMQNNVSFVDNIVDGANAISIAPSSRVLVDSTGGAESLDWNGRVALAAGGTVLVIDWNMTGQNIFAALSFDSSQNAFFSQQVNAFALNVTNGGNWAGGMDLDGGLNISSGGLQITGGIKDSSGPNLSIDTNARHLVAPNGSTVMADWTNNGSYTSINLPQGVNVAANFSVDTSGNVVSAGTITATPLTINRAAAIGGSHQLIASSTTSTELGFVSGVTSGIQAQINALLPGASANLTGQTGAVASIATLTPSGAGSFRVGGYLTVNAIATDVLNFEVTYTDETSTARTVVFTPMGTSSVSIGTTGPFTFPDIIIRAKASTAITMKTVLTTGLGTVSYDVGAYIQSVF